jgi:hypothetical protein
MVVLELKTFTITVNPTPTVDLPLSQTVCNGQSSAVILFSGAIQIQYTIGQTVIHRNWSNWRWRYPAFTAINNGTNPIVANFTVTQV